MRAASREPFRLRLMRRAIAAAALLGVLGGCGALSDQTASSVLTAPGKYNISNCKQLLGTLTATRARIDELQKLMTRASQDTAGQAIATLAYRADYLQARGDETEALRSIAEKNCKSDSTWTSERSMY